jgi:hypothetical protein
MATFNRYYKATRTDGTDFFTGTVDYAAVCGTGEVIRHPAARRVRNDPSTYLSVSTSEADCTGFRWPARLFRVEPVGRVMGSGKRPLRASPNKRAVSALRVIEELPSWRLFGPNGESVVALAERTERLTPDEKERLAAAWDASRDASREAAWDAAWAASREAARDAARHASREAAWDAAWEAAWDEAWFAAWCVARGAAWDAAWAAARAAAWAAAVALIVRDLISVEHFDTLYGPWRSVMEATDD